MSAQNYYKIGISKSDAQEIENIYDDFLGLLKELSGKTDTEGVTKTLADLVNSIIEILSSKKGESLLLYTSRIFDKDYIFAHSLNVCLISVRMGLKLGFGEGRLKDLGFLAIIHARKDIRLPEELSKKIEYDKESDEIIRLADVYDALTHPPVYRHAMTPCDTLTSLIKTDKFFDRRLIKILLQELSLYPKGSWVELSTGEIAKVIKANKEILLRPTVKAFFDGKGRHLKDTRTMDLSKNTVIYVLRPLTEQEIEPLKE